jgi:hypothetical protein
MVDRTKRDRAYSALHRFFVEGLTTNDEFEREYANATPTEDRAIGAIETMVWQFFSDHEVHRLTGKHAPDQAGRALLIRCLAFLRSEREYVWPVDNFIVVRDADPLSNLLTFGAAGRRREKAYREMMEHMAAAGDFSVWPFVSPGDLLEAEGSESANSL